MGVAAFDPDSYATPEKRTEVYDLLGLAWPGMPERIPPMEGAGCAWHVISTPFVLWEDGVPVSHAGVLEIELVVGGQPMRVGGIHAVVTRPDHRGRGHMRDVMQRAIAHCDARYETTILFGDPPMYERFGFRHVPRHYFRADVAPVKKVAPFEPLTDIDFLRGLLAKRDHISNVLGVQRSGHMFICNVLLSGKGLSTVYRSGDLVVAYAVKDGRLFLFDVVAERLPALDQILARIPEDVTTVRFGFTPDRMHVPGVRAELQDDDETIMVKGPWPIEGQQFDFPYLTEC